MTINKNRWKLIATSVAPIIGGTIVGIVANKYSESKYKKLKTPIFAPPSWVFPIVWTSLYTSMGIAKYKFDKTPKTSNLQIKGNSVYLVQLSFNYMWSFLFFSRNLRGAALIDALLLWITVNLNTYYFYKKSKVAGNLMIPYISWVTYTIALNYAIWSMNKEV